MWAWGITLLIVSVGAGLLGLEAVAAVVRPIRDVLVISLALACLVWLGVCWRRPSRGSARGVGHESRDS